MERNGPATWYLILHILKLSEFIISYLIFLHLFDKFHYQECDKPEVKWAIHFYSIFLNDFCDGSNFRVNECF